MTKRYSVRMKSEVCKLLMCLIELNGWIIIYISNLFFIFFFYVLLLDLNVRWWEWEAPRMDNELFVYWIYWRFLGSAFWFSTRWAFYFRINMRNFTVWIELNWIKNNSMLWTILMIDKWSSSAWLAIFSHHSLTPRFLPLPSFTNKPTGMTES